MAVQPLWTLAAFFSFFIYRLSVGLLGRRISLSQGRYLRTEQPTNKRTQISMFRVGFQPTIPVFEQAKRVHALDRAATVIGIFGPTKDEYGAVWDST
jgi:hypothetical protein